VIPFLSDVTHLVAVANSLIVSVDIRFETQAILFMTSVEMWGRFLPFVGWTAEKRFPRWHGISTMNFRVRALGMSQLQSRLQCLRLNPIPLQSHQLQRRPSQQNQPDLIHHLLRKHQRKSMSLPRAETH
jgi:hypothetical protein